MGKKKKLKLIKGKELQYKKILLILLAILGVIMSVYFVTSQTNYIYNSDAAETTKTNRCDETCKNKCSKVCNDAFSKSNYVNKKNDSALTMCNNTCRNTIYPAIVLDNKSCAEMCGRMRNIIRKSWCNKLCPSLNK